MKFLRKRITTNHPSLVVPRAFGSFHSPTLFATDKTDVMTSHECFEMKYHRRAIRQVCCITHTNGMVFFWKYDNAHCI